MMMIRVCATHEVVDCPMCSPTPDRAEPTPEAFRDLFSGHTKNMLIDVLYAQTQAAVEAEARASAPEQGDRGHKHDPDTCDECMAIVEESWRE